MSSSTSASNSDEENENLYKLKESIDPGFINDSLFGNPKELKIEEPKKIQKSERYLDLNDGNENSLFVTESMQSHFYKKLSQTIDSIVDFVDINDNGKGQKKKRKSQNIGGIKLLQGFDEYLQDPDDVVAEEPLILKRPQIKRKNLKDEVLIDDATKLKESVVHLEEIQTNFETKHWKTLANRDKVFHYREKNSKFYLQEPVNEFTKQRKKNNWDECKISRNYKKKLAKIAK